jgi:regulator of sigma D
MTYYIKNNVITTLPEYVEYVDVSGTPEDSESIVEEVERKLAKECDSAELRMAGYDYVSDYEYDPDFEKFVFENNEWVIHPTDAAIERDNAWPRIRNIRNNLLDYTDTLVMSYLDEGTDIPQQLKDDRQALRDFPQTYMTGEIDDWVQALATIKNFPIFGTTSLETEE